MESWQTHIPQTTQPLLQRRWVQSLIYGLGFGCYVLLFHLSPWGLNASPDLGPPSAGGMAAPPWMAAIFDFTGNNPRAYVACSLAMLLGGGFALFWLHMAYVKDLFWATALTFMWLSSPALVHHTQQLNTDVPALSVTFAGLYFFMTYGRNRRFWRLGMAGACFLLAGLLQPTAWVIPLAVLLLLAWERGFGFRIWPRKILFPHPGWQYFLVLGLAAAVFLLLKAPALLELRGIWQLSLDEIQGVVADFTSFWWRQLLPPAVWLLLGAIVGLAIQLRQHLKKEKLFLGALALCALLYECAYFSGFRQLDRLLLHLLPPLLVFLLYVLEASRWRFPAVFAPRKLQPYKIILGLLFLLIMYQSLQSLQHRQTLWPSAQVTTQTKLKAHK